MIKAQLTGVGSLCSGAQTASELKLDAAGERIMAELVAIVCGGRRGKEGGAEGCSGVGAGIIL